MKSIWKIYSNFWFRNLAIILLLWSIFTFAIYVDKGDKGLFLIWSELFLPFVMMYSFLLAFNRLLIERYLLTKRYGLFFLTSILFWSFVVFVSSSLSKLTGNFHSYVLEAFNDLFFGFMGAGAYFIHLWIYNNITARERKLVSTEVELDFLKMQLNPHFLLNAMNNLYGEALTNPKDTPDRILELSNLLRYQLGATKREWVDVREEIEFIEEYLNYYKFRSNKLYIETVYSGNFYGVQVPPLLFFSLVENAVKFCLESETPSIFIRWTYTKKGLLRFEVDNSCIGETYQKKGTRVGILNLERRLEVCKFKYKFENYRILDNSYKAILELWELPTNV
ncbi:sensor histidine kinase [Myroides injenensis]|uniref:sensor histidine kinase n=1 Tax=Myroides injenensis TaxID=1183151 RepID=UPI000288B6C1|nr:sensor histidine kinase [Myroides injenensis]